MELVRERRAAKVVAADKHHDILRKLLRGRASKGQMAYSHRGACCPTSAVHWEVRRPRDGGDYLRKRRGVSASDGRPSHAPVLAQAGGVADRLLVEQLLVDWQPRSHRHRRQSGTSAQPLGDGCGPPLGRPHSRTHL